MRNTATYQLVRAAGWRLILLALLLAACAAPQPSLRDRPALARDLAAYLTRLETAHATTRDIWAGLANQQRVTCGIRVSEPAAFTISETERRAFAADAAVLGALATARDAVAESVRLWDEECARPEARVEDPTLEAGLAAVEAAEAALAAAREALETWQEAAG